MFKSTRSPDPLPLALAQARQIVASPQPHHSEGLRRRAWAVLKSARNQRVIQSRIPRTADPKGAA